MKNKIILLPLCALLLCGCVAEAAGISDRYGSEPEAAPGIGAESAFSAVVLSAVPETVPPKTTTAASEAPASDTSETPERKKAPETLTLLGPNMVYVGESFTYSFELGGEGENAPELIWICSGDCASVDGDGRLEALKKGETKLTVMDAANDVQCTLQVHLVETAADVDFVPTVNGIPVVNKTYPLPADYCPGTLEDDAYDAFTELVDGAALEGIGIAMISGFRSYGFQEQVHNGWVEEYGEEIADTLSARAGFSEHQLGLSIDVNSVLSAFAYTPEGIWLAENCWKYGFIIRYPAGKEDITGYIYEPWHIRYVGRELAGKITKSGLCFEEYFGIDSYYR